MLGLAPSVHELPQGDIGIAPLPVLGGEETCCMLPAHPKPQTLPRGFLLPCSHLPNVIQELRGGQALLGAGKLLAVILEKGQQVRVQIKQPATAREKPPSPHVLNVVRSPVCPASSAPTPPFLLLLPPHLRRTQKSQRLSLGKCR